MIDVIGKRKYFLIFSGALVLSSWILIGALGLRPGIDLKGGTRWEISFIEAKPAPMALEQLLREKSGFGDISVKALSENRFILRLPHLDENQHQKYLEALSEFGQLREENFASIGPVIGEELRRKAILAIILVMVGISVYIAWAFRKVSDPVKSWKYGVVTLATLFHDVSIPAGLLAVLGRLKGVEIDTNFIVALLVVMGFSVHDTIVVFDRIRENILLSRGRGLSLEKIINQSVSETFARSVNTSLTLVLVLVALMLFGPPTLFYFVLTILAGTIFGTYSSIFVASPLLYLWQRKKT
jgi:preprotein translocase subunit SecF